MHVLISQQLPYPKHSTHPTTHNPSSFPMQTIQLNRPLTTDDRLISKCMVIYIYSFNSGGVMIYILHQPRFINAYIYISDTFPF